MEDTIVDDHKLEIEDILDSQPYHFLTRGYSFFNLTFVQFSKNK